MEPLYINIGQAVEVNEQTVLLKDIAKMSCSDRKIVSRLKTLKIISVQEKTYGRYVVSVLAIIEKIHEIYPQLEIVNLGEAQFLLTYRAPEKVNKFCTILKVAFVCRRIFRGSICNYDI